MSAGVGSFEKFQLNEGGPTPVTARVSPTERIRAQIDELFASEGDLAQVLEEVARLASRHAVTATPVPPCRGGETSAQSFCAVSSPFGASPGACAPARCARTRPASSAGTTLSGSWRAPSEALTPARAWKSGGQVAQLARWTSSAARAEASRSPSRYPDTCSRASQQLSGTLLFAARRSLPCANALTRIILPRRRRCLAAGSEIPRTAAIWPSHMECLARRRCGSGPDADGAAVIVEEA